MQLERQWTFEDIHALPEDGNRYEVIDGVLFVTPAPVWRHQRAAGRLHAALLSYLEHERVGSVLQAPADVVFSPRRAVQPDVFVVPLVEGRHPQQFEDVRKLLLAVEVLSPSTARTDRVVKRNLFREEGVDEYWIVDLDARTIERSTPVDSRSEVCAEHIAWMPVGATVPFELDLARYFAAVLDD